MTPKDWRLKAGKTQKELASLLNCQKSYVSLIETGKRTPSLALVQKYHQITKGKVTLSDFGGVQ